MPIEIRELVINTSVENSDKVFTDGEQSPELYKRLKTELLKDCLDILKDYLDRQIQK